MTWLQHNVTLRTRTVAEASPCEQGDLSAETTLLGSHGRGELCDSDPTPLGDVRCFQVTSWKSLHGAGKPPLPSWHAVAPGVALSKAKRQICSEPSVFKRFGASSSAQGSKWKSIREVQMGRFSSCSCLSAVPVYIYVCYTCTEPLEHVSKQFLSLAVICTLVQQQIIICLTGKITAEEQKWFFPSANAQKYIWNILWVHCTPDGNIYDCFFTGYIRNILSQLHCFYQLYSFILCSFWPGFLFFFLSITDEFATTLICSSKWSQNKSSLWSTVCPIKSMRGWCDICLCACANCCVGEGQGRERCLDLVWTQESLLVIAFCWPTTFLVCIPPNN